MKPILATPAEATALPLPTGLRLLLLALVILGAAIWIGGMAAVTMLSVISRRILAPGDRAHLFRDFGRRFLTVAGTSMVVTVICGALLLVARGWDGIATAIAVLVGMLFAALGLGVRQARAIGRLRHVVAGQESAAEDTAGAAYVAAAADVAGAADVAADADATDVAADPAADGAANAAAEGPAAQGSPAAPAAVTDAERVLAARVRHARMLRALLGLISAAIFALAICTAA